MFYIEGFELVECEMLVVDGNIVVEKVINGCECILMFLEIYVVYYWLIFVFNLKDYMLLDEVIEVGEKVFIMLIKFIVVLIKKDLFVEEK